MRSSQRESTCAKGRPRRANPHEIVEAGGGLCDGPAVSVADEPQREDGRIRRARELKVARRANIIAAIRDVFAERGYHHASLSELLAAADIARGTFYLHFDSKEAAFKAVLDDLLDRIAGTVRPVDTTSIDAAKHQLEGNIARAFRLLADDPGIGRLLFRQGGSVSDDLTQHLDAFFAAIAALAERSLRVGQALGLVKPGDISFMAKLALGLFKEAALALDEGKSPEDVAQAVLDMVLSGVLAPRVASRQRGG